MRAVLIASAVCLIATSPAGAQATSSATDASPESVAREWIERWNALGAAPETVDAFVALYEPDALHITGPTLDQRGTATYRGHDGIRVLATRVAATEDRRTYRLETETARETTASLFHQTAGPWGGGALAVQIVAAYTDHATQKRYAIPGALFLQLNGAKIRRARVYLGEGERAEVEAEPAKRRPQPPNRQIAKSEIARSPNRQIAK